MFFKQIKKYVQYAHFYIEITNRNNQISSIASPAETTAVNGVFEVFV